jgi:hypothetical protein
VKVLLIDMSEDGSDSKLKGLGRWWDLVWKSVVLDEAIALDIGLSSGEKETCLSALARVEEATASRAQRLRDHSRLHCPSSGSVWRLLPHEDAMNLPPHLLASSRVKGKLNTSTCGLFFDLHLFD